jgi:hypothetical protein
MDHRLWYDCDPVSRVRDFSSESSNTEGGMR